MKKYLIFMLGIFTMSACSNLDETTSGGTVNSDQLPPLSFLHKPQTTRRPAVT